MPRHAGQGPKRASVNILAVSPILSHLPPGYARRNPDAPASTPLDYAASAVAAGAALRPTASAYSPDSPLRPPVSASQVGSTCSPSSTLRGSLRHGLDSSLPPPSVSSSPYVHPPAAADALVSDATPTPTPLIGLGPSLTPVHGPCPFHSQPQSANAAVVVVVVV